MRINLGITNMQSNSTNCSAHACLGEIYTYRVIQVAQLKSHLRSAHFSQKLSVWNLIPLFSLLDYWPANLQGEL